MSGRDVDRLLTPGEVAARCNVHPKTVSRWARKGLLSPLVTFGGHRRYPESQILALTKPDPETACVCGCPAAGHHTAQIGRIERAMGCRRHRTCVEFISAEERQS